MSGGLADAVKNGPRARNAKVADLEARIRLAEAGAKRAKGRAASHRRKAAKSGPLAEFYKAQTHVWDRVADDEHAKADELRVELAKLKASQAAEDAKRAGRVVASTRDEFGTGPASPDRRPGQVANPGPPIGQSKRHPSGLSASRRCQRCDDRRRVTVAGEFWVCEPCANEIDYPSESPSKGHPMTGAISGEAVDIEQTEANIAQIKTSVADLRGALEGLSGSLASGGLNKLAGTFSQADDGLDSLSGPLAEAEKYLADQRGIAEAAQAAGEMHTNSSFYGAAGAGAGSGFFPRNENLLKGTRLK